MIKDFLPITIEDVKKRGWDYVDFVYVIADAYVDHPSFGHAIISRILEAHGYRVAIISQPDWKNEDSIKTFGKPRLGFLVTGGNMDSMVNHYSVSKRRRDTDAYTPGGIMGKRPDYATVVYSNLIRKVYKDVPIIIGGIEASLRRLSHYDYWSNKMKHSIIVDSQADLLIYGMGEHAIIEIADALNSGIEAKYITFVRGTVYRTRSLEDLDLNECIILPDYETIKNDKIEYARSFNEQYMNTDAFTAKILVEKNTEREYAVQNPPSYPLSMQEMDDVYELNYMRAYHPSYDKDGGVPAIKEIKFSLTSVRGCYGGCSFCALTFHQGRIIQARSHESIIKEAKLMIQDPEFKGYIHDVGGPSANFRQPACDKQLKYGVCKNKQCLFPRPCQNLKVDHKDYLELLRKLRALPGVKKVFVRSGIRFDYVMADKDGTFLSELCKYHVSGQLKVAPEHITDNVLSKMGKPETKVYRDFVERFNQVNKKLGLKQYLVPYLMSSHPGSTLKDAVLLAEYLRDLGYMPEQVQDFYPTPSTISTCMYYTGVDPRNLKPVYTPHSPHEKAMQRALIQYRDPKNYDLVKEALILADRKDLIGFDSKCLIKPRKFSKESGSVEKTKTEKTKIEKTKIDKSKNDKTVKKGNKSVVENKPKKTNEKRGQGAGNKAKKVDRKEIGKKGRKNI